MYHDFEDASYLFFNHLPGKYIKTSFYLTFLPDLHTTQAPWHKKSVPKAEAHTVRIKPALSELHSNLPAKGQQRNSPVQE